MNRLHLAAAVVIALATAAPALAKDDAKFLHKALEGDNSEMRLGRLAEQQGYSRGIRNFGRMLATDHAAARKQAVPVAKAHNVRLTEEMAPEASAEYRKLRRMHGWAFDAEFARYMVKDHRKDISDFEKQARHGDKSTRRLAQHTLPTLRKHLRTAEGLARR